MTNTKNLIIQLKQVREEKNLSYADINDLIEKSGGYPLAKSTLSRLFAEGSEDESFKYEETLRPVAIALFDVNDNEEEDSKDVRVLKSMIQLNTQTINNNKQLIERIEAAHASEMLNIHEKIEQERERWEDHISFLKQQIVLKDELIKSYSEAVKLKDSQYQTLLDTIMSCPCRKAKEMEG